MNTIGYHIVISGYGLWLPGDDRGHWSDAWDAELGFVEPHQLHAGDPIRQRMARERLSHEPVRLTPAMVDIVLATLERCQAESDWELVAVSIEATHTHLLMTYSERNLDTTVKWVKDQTTKSIHCQTDHSDPIWCKGRWRSFVFEPAVWEAVRRYIERHNERRGLATHPFHKAATVGRAGGGTGNAHIHRPASRGR
jgi:REP element-mobilizing transposase RayT